jgi:hypothetical protein
VAIILVSVGAVIALVGLWMLYVAFSDARKARARAGSAQFQRDAFEKGVTVDVGKILEEINRTLDKVHERYRVGLILVLVGSTLMIVAFVVK